MKKTKSSSDEGHSTFILNKKPIPDVTLIVHEKSLDKNLLVRIVQECCTPYFYHKFIIGNIGTYSKKYILKAISNFVYPASFRALHYTVIKNKAVFLSRNCQELLLRICSENFRITNPECPDTPFKVIILANFILYEEVQMEDDSQSIIDVIKKRFKNETETIDLSEFSEDKGLTDYYPLFQMKFLLAVTSTIAEFSPKHLNLQNNCIRDISNLHPLKDFIESIDLCNNMIEDISALMPLINFKTLKNLSLSGNPFCEKYDNYNYVLDVKRYCQNLEKLDGFDVTIPVFQKNNFCTPDAIDLVTNFMEHFFTVYDSNNRENLIDLYDKDALFSTTAKIVPNQKNSSSAQLDHYGLKIPYVIYGATEIMKLFKTFPKTYHDPYPPVCDVTLFTDTHVSLVIGGVLREHQQILSFTRHFVFKRSDDKYVITNDQYHVSNALDFQTGWSFGFPMHLTISGNPLPYFQEEYRELEEAVHKITTMNYEYSQKYLDYCQYDLKKTLHLFSQLHARGDVPENAFTPESATPQQFQQGFLPYSEKMRKLVYKKHKSINLKTIWETLHSERMRTLSDKPRSTDPTIKKIYRNVIIPTIDDSPIASFESVKSIQANPKPVSFNIQVPITAKDKPVQKVKPATKANVDPLVELAEKIAKHKKLANKKANELLQTSVSDSGAGSINQALAALPSMVPPPNQSLSDVAQLNHSLGVNLNATNFTPSSILGPVPGPHFTSAAAMSNPFLPGQPFLGDPGTMQPIHHGLPPHLMPAQFQMHAGFPARQRFPMHHQFPVPVVPELQGGPRSLFPIPKNSYQSSVIEVPKVTVAGPAAVPVGSNTATAVCRPRGLVPIPTGAAMMPRAVGVSSQFSQLRAPVPPNTTGSDLRPSGVLRNKERKRRLRKRKRSSNKCRKLLATTDENLDANTVEKSELTECSEENSSDVNKIIDEKCESHEDDNDNGQCPVKKGRYNPSKRQRFLNKCRKLLATTDENLDANTVEKSELTECSEENSLDVNKSKDEKCESHEDDNDDGQCLAKKETYNPSKGNENASDDLNLEKATEVSQQYMTTDLSMSESDSPVEMVKKINIKLNRLSKSATDTRDVEYSKPPMQQYSDEDGVKPPPTIFKKMDIKLNRISKSASDTRDEEKNKTSQLQCSNKDGSERLPQTGKKIDIKLNMIMKPGANPEVQTGEVSDMIVKKTGRPNHGRRQRFLIKRRKFLDKANKNLDPNTVNSEPTECSGENSSVDVNKIIDKQSEPHKDDDNGQSPVKKGRYNPSKRQRLLRRRALALANEILDANTVEKSELIECTNGNSSVDVNKIIEKKSGPHKDDNWQSLIGDVYEGLPTRVESGDKNKTSGRLSSISSENSDGPNKKPRRGRSRDARSRRSRSKSRSRSHSLSRSRKKRSSSRNRNRRSGDRSKRSRSHSKDRTKRSRSRSKDRTKRSRSRSKDRTKRSRSRSKNRTKRSRSRSKDRSRRSRSRSKNRSRRSRSRSKGRSRRSRSSSKDKAKCSRSGGKNDRSRRSSSPSQTANSKNVRSRITRKTDDNRSPRSENKKEGSETDSQATSSTNSPSIVVLSGIAKIKRGYKSKWDVGPLPETTSSSSLLIERSPSGAVVSVSTAKNLPTGGCPSISNMSTDKEYALSLAERKRRLDVKIQLGLQKIQKLSALRHSASNENKKNESTPEVCSANDDVFRVKEGNVREDTAKKIADENSLNISHEKIIKDGEYIGESLAVIQKNSIPESTDETIETEKNTPPKSMLEETSVNLELEKLESSRKESIVVGANLIKPLSEIDSKASEVALLKTSSTDNINAETGSDNVQILKPKDMTLGISLDDTNNAETVSINLKTSKPEVVSVGVSLDAETNSDNVKTPKSEVLPVEISLDDTKNTETISDNLKTPKSEVVSVEISLDDTKNGETISDNVKIPKSEIVSVGISLDDTKNAETISDNVKIPKSEVLPVEISLCDTKSTETISDNLKTPKSGVVSVEISLDDTKNAGTIFDNLKIPKSEVLPVEVTLDDTKNAETTSINLKTPKSEVGSVGVCLDDTKNAETISDNVNTPKSEVLPVEVSLDDTKNEETISDSFKTPKSEVMSTKNAETIFDNVKTPKSEILHVEVALDVTKNAGTISDNLKIPKSEVVSLGVSLNNTNNAETTSDNLKTPKSEALLVEVSLDDTKNADTIPDILKVPKSEVVSVGVSLDGTKNAETSSENVDTIGDLKPSHAGGMAVEVSENLKIPISEGGYEVGKEEIGSMESMNSTPKMVIPNTTVHDDISENSSNMKDLLITSDTNDDEHGKSDSREDKKSSENKLIEESTSSKTLHQKTDEQKTFFVELDMRERIEKEVYQPNTNSNKDLVRTSKMAEVEVQKLTSVEPIEKMNEEKIVTESHAALDISGSSSDKPEICETLSREYTAFDSVDNNSTNIVDADGELTRASKDESVIKASSINWCTQQAIEDNVDTPKPTDVEFLKTLTVVQPCDQGRDNDIEDNLDQTPDEVDKINANKCSKEVSEDMTTNSTEAGGKKSEDEKTTMNLTDVMLSNVCTRKKSVDESTYAIDKIVQLADGMINPDTSSASTINQVTTDGNEFENSKKQTDKMIDTNRQLAENVKTLADSNEKDVENAENEEKEITDGSQNVGKPETDSKITDPDGSVDNENKKLAADYSRKLIVQLRNVAIDIDSTIKKNTHTEKSATLRDDHQPEEPKQTKRHLDEISIAKKLKTNKHLTINLVRMSLGVNFNREEIEEKTGGHNKQIEKKRQIKIDRRLLTKGRPEKSLEGNSSSDRKKDVGENKTLEIDTKPQSRESSEEPILISENIPLVQVESSDEETQSKRKSKRTEETLINLTISNVVSVAEEIPTSHDTDNEKVASFKQVPSSSYDNNDENVTKEVNDTTMIRRDDSPILLTISSDEEDTSHDKICFIVEDSDDEELEYVGLKDILGAGK